MSDPDLISAMESLASAIREQNQVQQEIAASNRALTEMLSHTVTAVKELTERLDASDDAPSVTDASLQFIG